LGRGVNDRRRPYLCDKAQNPLPVADVDLVVLEASNRSLQPAQVPACIALGAEEDRALVAVDSVHLPSSAPEILTNLTPDQARRACYNHSPWHEHFSGTQPYRARISDCKREQPDNTTNAEKSAVPFSRTLLNRQKKPHLVQPARVD
jgi:hypothetical protein